MSCHPDPLKLECLNTVNFYDSMLFKGTPRRILPAMLKMNTSHRFMIPRKPLLLFLLLLYVNSQHLPKLVQMESLIDLSRYPKASCLSKTWTPPLMAVFKSL